MCIDVYSISIYGSHSATPFPPVGTPSCRAAAALDATEGTGAAGAGATPVATSRTRGVATGGTGFSVPNS